MNLSKRITRVYNSSEEIPINDKSRIVLVSDCHRGDGRHSDNFSKNENCFIAALNYYDRKGYCYIEIGDGDELWENRRFKDIVEAHEDVFFKLSKFYRENRLYFIYGNHDMVKKNNKFIKKNLYQYYDENKRHYIPLFPDIKIHEGLILDYRTTGDKILLTHGHQLELLNSSFWKLSRFLVRYLWNPLELYGVNNPTRTAKNHKKQDRMARQLTKWSVENKHMVIAGHNHIPTLAEVGFPPYFNCGSSVHPRCITAIEIIDGDIMLVKWCTKVNKDGILFIDREILAGPRRLKDYFNMEEDGYERSFEAAKKQKIS